MSEPLQLAVKLLHAGARLPRRATPGASGFDLYACLQSELEVGEEPVRVPTGIAIEAPRGVDVQIRPRSGLSSKGVIASFGTIDSDYRGELLVTMFVLPYRGPHTIRNGDRIAQLVISRLADAELYAADDLSGTARSAGGHGSTGR